MRWLLFLSRLAFICGIFFLLTVSLAYKNWMEDPDVTSSIIIIGYFFGLFFIPAVNICYFIVLVVKKHLRPVPLWLSLSNLLFLFLQLVYVIFLN